MRGAKAMQGLIERAKARKDSRGNYAHYKRDWPDNWYNKHTQWGKSPK